jgi:hypothetical protein
MALTGRLGAPLGRLVAIDLRTLAAFRMALGAMVLADLAIRFPDLAPFYGEDGILSRAARLEHWGMGNLASIWDLVAGSAPAGAALFALTAGAALALVVGWHSRIAALVCWLAVQGFVIRMPAVATGGDLLLAALLLWSLFLPLGARASFDALRRPPADRPVAITSAATAALLIQVAAMFCMTGGAKLVDPAWRAGDGVYYALHAEFYTTPLADALRAQTWLLTPLSHAVLAFEVLGVLLVVSPWRRDATRLVYVGGLIAMNLGFWLCLKVGIFSWVAMTAALVFVPGSLWDHLERRTGLAAAARRLATRLPVRRGAPRPWRLSPSRPTVGLIVVIGLLTIYGNLHPTLQRAPRPVLHATRAIAMQQRGWPMFAPTAKDHGWFVVPGTLRGGALIDLHEGGGPLSFDEPARISEDFASYRWRKLYFNMRRSAALRRLYLDYLCRAWNAHHDGDRSLAAVELVYMKRQVLLGGQRTPVAKTRLERRTCAAPPPPPPRRGSAADEAESE